MILKAPFEIGSRLLPELKIGDGLVSLEHVGCQGHHLVYRWYIDIPAGEFSAADLKSPRDDLQEMFASLLNFLSACGEAYGYWMHREGADSLENLGLFPEPVAEWAYTNHDEIDMLALDLETPGLIEEGGE